MNDATAPKHRSGIVTTDPLKDLGIGAEIHFLPRLFVTDGPAGLADINNWDFFDGALVGILFGKSDDPAMLGCGVLVAPGIAVIARHVIEAEMQAVMFGKGIICAGIGTKRLMFWRPRTVTLHPANDVAILTLEYASALPDSFHQAAVTTRTPKIGERILIAGLRHEASDGPSSGQGTLHVRSLAAIGHVTNCYEAGRDRIMLPGPVLEVDCAALGGMSGGPAFDETGHLIGILSSSIDDETGRGPAFVSMIWPALGLEIKPTWPPGLYKNPTTLIELDSRVCAIEGREAIELRNRNGKMAYRVWSDQKDQ